MAINLAKRASDKVVEGFQRESATEGIFTDRYKWTGVATVQVYTIDALPLHTYSSAATSSSRFGALTEVGDTMQEMMVVDDKCFNGAIDKGNNTSQMKIKSASAILKKMTNDVIIPYVDKYRLEKLVAGAGIVINSATITKDNIVEHIFDANVQMSNQNVPKNGRVLFMGETLAMQLKLSEKVLGADKLAEEAVVNGVCGVIDGVQIRIVPDSYMPNNVAYIIVKKGCAVAPKKIETYRVIENDKDIDGAIVQGRFLHDCFVLDGLKKGVLAVKTA